jgi:hypothetical protein
MKWRSVGSALLLALAVRTANAQQQPDPLTKLDLQSLRQVQGIIDSARSAGLPWNSLRLKAVEFVAKKYKNEQIVKAVRDYYRSLAAARTALGPLASAEDLEAGAALLAAHVSTDDLAKFKVSSAGRSPMWALVYVTDLIANRRVPNNEAIDAFSKLWADGAAAADFDGLWHAVDQDILSGLNPRSALQSRMRSMPRLSKPPGEVLETPHS